MILQEKMSASVEKTTERSGSTDKIIKDNVHMFSFLRKCDAPLIIVAAIFTCLSAVIPVATTYVISEVFLCFTRFIDDYYNSLPSFIHALKIRCIGIALIGLGATIFNWIQVASFTSLAERQQGRCRIKLYQTLLKKDFQWFEKGSQTLNGELIQLNRSFEEYRSAIGEFSSTLFKSVFTVIALLVTSFILSWRLSLLILVSVPIISLVLYISGHFIDKWATSEDSTTSKAASILDWNIVSCLWVKLLNTQAQELQKYDNQLKHIQHSFKQFNIYTTLAAAFTRAFTLILFVQSFWFGSFLVRKNYNTSNEIISAFYACLNVASTFSTISIILVVLQKGKASFEKIQRFLDTHDFDDSQQSEYVPPSLISGNIDFEKVTFAYSTVIDSRPALKDVTTTIPANKFTFLVGKSGSGKSSFSSLLTRLYDFQKGHIYLDGYDLRGLNKHWLRRQITFVQQFSPLLNGTIKENISMGFEKFVDQLTLGNALQNACLCDFVDKLPDQVYSVVGNGSKAINLSGGERQRVALARAFFRNTPIMILDESMSAVDLNTRKQLMANLRTSRKGKTTIIISHDLSIIEDDDNVILLNEGEVVESGSKRQLCVSAGSAFVDLEQSFTASTLKLSHPSDMIKWKTTANYNEEKESDKRLSIIDELGKPTKAEKQRTFPLIRSLISILPKYQIFVYVIGIILFICESVLTPVFSFFFSKLISGVVPQNKKGLTSEYYQMKWSLILTGICFAEGILSVVSKIILGDKADMLVQKIRHLCFSGILNTSLSDTLELKKAEFNTLLMNDTRDLRTVFSSCIASIVGGIIIFIVGVVWATILGWKLSLVGLSFFPIFGIAVILSSMISRTFENRYKESVVNVEETVDDTISGIKMIVCLDMQGSLKDKFSEKINSMISIGQQRSICMGLCLSIAQVIIALAQSILIYYGLKLVVLSEYTLVQMMQVVMIILFSTAFSASLVGCLPNFERGLRVGRKLYGMLRFGNAPHNEESEKFVPEKPCEKDAFELKDVSFSYPSMKKKLILNCCNLSIPKNSITCLVGPSGCGKTTISMLLLNLYSPDSGKVSCEDIDERLLQTKWLRDHISVVPQSYYFIEGSIRENMLYGNPYGDEINDNNIMDSLNCVNLSQYINSLPGGLDTQIGGDVKDMIFSGGQAQRLCIARALLRNTKIIVLDECTSSLDPFNSNLIIELLQRLKHNVTIIVITHMKELMEAADKIYMIKHGRVKEEGTFKELVSRKGSFYNMLTGFN